jgi:hypothetical protein
MTKMKMTIGFIVVIVVYAAIRNLSSLGFIPAFLIALGLGVFAYLIGRLIGLPTEKEKELWEKEEERKKIEAKRTAARLKNVSRLGMTKEEAEKEKIVEEMMKKDGN